MLSGKNFGRLTVIEWAACSTNKSRMKIWRCRCHCGKEVLVAQGHLVSGDTKSCGCYRSDKQKTLLTRHGMASSRLYRIWICMRRRCEDKNNNRYSLYGGRGVTICNEWRTFEGFSRWAQSSGYKENLSIDRIDNDGNCCPENCRWSTPKIQARNRSTSAIYEGRTIAEWAELLSMSPNLLQQRLVRDKLSFYAAITKPVRGYMGRPSFIPADNLKAQTALCTVPYQN